MLINKWQELEYRLDICRATTGAHIEAYGCAWKSFWVTLYTVENINFIKRLGTKNISMYFCIPLARTPSIYTSFSLYELYKLITYFQLADQLSLIKISLLLQLDHFSRGLFSPVFGPWIFWNAQVVIRNSTKPSTEEYKPTHTDVIYNEIMSLLHSSV